MCERLKLHDLDYAVVLERLNKFFADASMVDNPILWHKDCYSSFTSEGRLERLRKQRGLASGRKSDEEFAINQRRPTRIEPVDWQKCIICQNQDRSKLRTVQTMELSAKLIALANNDSIMRVRVADVNDLVAADGKYHLKCWVKFQRRMNKLLGNQGEDEAEKSLNDLCTKLLTGLRKGCIFDMGHVWDRYVQSCESKGVNVPKKYQSRRYSFYKDVRQRIGTQGNFVPPMNRQTSLMLYPTDSFHSCISESLERATHSADEESDSSDCLKMESTSAVQNIIHAALTLRKELESTAGHDSCWLGIDDEGIERVVPEGVYLFLCVLLGGTTALSSEEVNSDAVGEYVRSKA